MQEDAGGGRSGGGGEISFVNQKRPGPGGAHPGFSSTISLLKGRLAMLHILYISHREMEDLGLCGGGGAGRSPLLSEGGCRPGPPSAPSEGRNEKQTSVFAALGEK